MPGFEASTKDTKLSFLNKVQKNQKKWHFFFKFEKRRIHK